MTIRVRSSETHFTEAGQLASAGDYLALMKPRVMSLVIFTCLAGMYLSGGEAHPVLALISLLAISVGAGASGAINQWYDRDMDSVMARTRSRPLPAGKIAPSEALAFGLIAAALSVLVLALSAGYLAAGLLAFTIFFYAVIYTVWLKRRTPQNIVIGGAAGALPPLVGWGAVTGEVTLNSLLLFAIIFFWTPPHFWALALFRHADYKKAGVPMLPVVAGAKETRKQILIYALILAPLAVLPVATGLASVWYGLVAGALGLVFVWQAAMLMRFGDEKRALGLFKFSIFYLFLIFAGLMADQVLRGWL
jgi:protoheme IX farnesyltransferase